MSAQSNCLYVAALTERELIQTGTSAPIRAAVLGWREALTELLRAALPATDPRPNLTARHGPTTSSSPSKAPSSCARAMEDNRYMKVQLAALRAATAAMLR